MKPQALLILISFLLILNAKGQIRISGVVKTPDGKGIECANVSAFPLSAPKNILGSVFTDESGAFQMDVKCECDSLLLKASGMEISPKEDRVPNRDGNYEILVEEKAIDLKEIIVKRRKIYSEGDTINYNVGSFLSNTDRSIADVLKKMPGVTVSDAGQVAYQGKPIKNFYIEGLDLMKGHYGIATNSIDPNNIATVQILENHQDIKALKGLRPEEQASINLRLKDGVKGVFTLITVLGGGYGEEVLWDNSALATLFRRNSQLLATYKEQYGDRPFARAILIRQ